MQKGLPEFIPGLELSRHYYVEVIGPLLAESFPELRYSAGLLGYGSEVIGCDTPLSRDHMWGPRLVLFLPENGFEEVKVAVDAALRWGLPHTFLGYPTGSGPSSEQGVWIMTPADRGEVDHLVQLTNLPAFFAAELGKGWEAPTAADWLTFSESRLLTATSGAVFHDDLGLAEIRARLAYYPQDVWLFLLASEWSKIGQEEPFVGRTGSVGDELGSRIVAARLAHTCMRLAFLLERRYAPYSKWFGTHFQRLEIGPKLGALLAEALAAVDWQTREALLCRAYELLAEKLNALGLAELVETHCSSFHARPFQVIHADQITARLQERITDPVLRRLRPYGSVNQYSASTDFLEEIDALEKMKTLYE